MDVASQSVVHAFQKGRANNPSRKRCSNGVLYLQKASGFRFSLKWGIFFISQKLSTFFTPIKPDFMTSVRPALRYPEHTVKAEQRLPFPPRYQSLFSTFVGELVPNISKVPRSDPVSYLGPFSIYQNDPSLPGSK